MVKETPLINTDTHINVLDNPYVGFVCAKMAMSKHKGKKKIFSDREIKMLVGETEARKNVLFGSQTVDVVVLPLFYTLWVGERGEEPGLQGIAAVICMIVKLVKQSVKQKRMC